MATTGLPGPLRVASSTASTFSPRLRRLSSASSTRRRSPSMQALRAPSESLAVRRPIWSTCNSRPLRPRASLCFWK